jgi:hypothetical protein
MHPPDRSSWRRGAGRGRVLASANGHDCPYCRLRVDCTLMVEPPEGGREVTKRRSFGAFAVGACAASRSAALGCGDDRIAKLLPFLFHGLTSRLVTRGNVNDPAAGKSCKAGSRTRLIPPLPETWGPTLHRECRRSATLKSAEQIHAARALLRVRSLFYQRDPLAHGAPRTAHDAPTVGFDLRRRSLRRDNAITVLEDNSCWRFSGRCASSTRGQSVAETIGTRIRSLTHSMEGPVSARREPFRDPGRRL